MRLRYVSPSPMWLSTCTWALLLPICAKVLANAQAFVDGAAAVRDVPLAAPRLNEARGQTAARLEQAQALAVNERWDEAIQIFSDLATRTTGEVVPLTMGRYLSLRAYCHLQIAQAPADGLTAYRQRVDPIAERSYQTALARRDERLLRQVVREYFCSSWGDDALMALGELALERGDYATARRVWQQISPLLCDPRGFSVWTGLANIDLASHWSEVERLWHERDVPVDWLVYPDTDLDLAEVRARLVLVSLRAGDLDRAALELNVLRRLHPQASGRLGGQVVPLAATLEQLLAAAEQWPRPGSEWDTFAGSTHRTGSAPELDAHLIPAWQSPVPLTPPTIYEFESGMEPFFSADAERIHADQAMSVERHISRSGVSTYPIIVGEFVVFADARGIRAVGLATGSPSVAQDGVLYHDPTDDQQSELLNTLPLQEAAIMARRYTLTSESEIVYAHLSTDASGTQDAHHPNAERIVGLDLTRDGMLTLGLRPESASWTFGGAPVSDGERIFVALWHNEVMPHAYVGCFDAATGAGIWQTPIASANLPGAHPVGGSLLTLVGGRIYFNTNLGIIAAICADTGEVEWLYRYERSGPPDASVDQNRSPNPCVFYGGLLLVAPTDTRELLAIDANTGKPVWTSTAVGEAVQLIGVSGNQLIASGHRLHAFDVRTGKRQFTWPESEEAGIRGMGRGLVAGQEVFWPTRDAIHVISVVTGSLTRAPIQIDSDLKLGANLAAGRGYLVVAAGDQLTVLGPPARLSGQQEQQR